MSAITKNFTYEEFTASDTAKRNGVLNHITDFATRDNVKALAEEVLQPLRDKLQKPITISSGYRCPKLNELVGGAKNSYHTNGSAADIIVRGMVPYEVARVVLDMGLEFEEMGLANNYLHIAYNRDENNKREIFYYGSYKGKRL